MVVAEEAGTIMCNLPTVEQLKTLFMSQLAIWEDVLALDMVGGYFLMRVDHLAKRVDTIIANLVSRGEGRGVIEEGLTIDAEGTVWFAVSKDRSYATVTYNVAKAASPKVENGGRPFSESVWYDFSYRGIIIPLYQDPLESFTREQTSGIKMIHGDVPLGTRLLSAMPSSVAGISLDSKVEEADELDEQTSGIKRRDVVYSAEELRGIINVQLGREEIWTQYSGHLGEGEEGEPTTLSVNIDANLSKKDAERLLSQWDKSGRIFVETPGPDSDSSDDYSLFPLATLELVTDDFCVINGNLRFTVDARREYVKVEIVGGEQYSEDENGNCIEYSGEVIEESMVSIILLMSPEDASQHKNPEVRRAAERELKYGDVHPNRERIDGVEPGTIMYKYVHTDTGLSAIDFRDGGNSPNSASAFAKGVLIREEGNNKSSYSFSTRRNGCSYRIEPCGCSRA